MTSDQESETSSDSIYDDDDSPQEINSSNTETSIYEDDVMEPEMPESSKNKRRREPPLDHPHAERESQRPRTSELLKSLKALTNCNKTSKVDIMDAAADYIKAMEAQIEMMQTTTNLMHNIALGMYDRMRLLPGLMIRAPAATTSSFQEMCRVGTISQTQLLGMFNPYHQFSFNPVSPPTSTSIGPSESYPSVSSDSTATSQVKAKSPS